MSVKNKSLERGKQDGTSVPAYTAAFGERLTEVIRLLDGLKKAAAHAGVTDETLASWRDGRSEPRFLGLHGLAQAAGVRLDWLATGEGPMRQAPANAGSAGNGVDFVGIPRYDARLAAGGGSFNERSRQIDEIPFTRSFLRRKLGRAEADGLIVLEVSGDSMEPLIGEGDLVLVDTRDKALADTIMAFVADDFAYVKRLQLTDNGVDAISTNRDVPVRHFSSESFAEVQVIGRVRWIGRMI